MADEPFPPEETAPIPTAIGDRQWTIVFIEGDDPYADYSVQILDQYGAVMDVNTGALFRVGGIDHLTAAEKQALIALDARLKANLAADANGSNAVAAAGWIF